MDGEILYTISKKQIGNIILITIKQPIKKQIFNQIRNIILITNILNLVLILTIN